MRFLITIFALFIFTGLLKSQDIRFSYMANPQMTWFSGKGNNFGSDGSFLGINTGIELDFFFLDNYAFSTGIFLQGNSGGVIYTDSINYVVDGTDYLLAPGSRLKYGLQYVGVPLGLKFKTIEIGYSTYWINTGITPMVLIQSKATDERDVFTKTPFKDFTRLFNMNYFVEGGIEYSLGGNTAVVAGIGYHSGFIDITKSDNEKLTSRGFSIILGLLF